MVDAILPSFIQALCDPALHGNPKAGVRVVETHISWVVLAGEYAYKIKKPVDYGFVNYATLALRHSFCQEEFRLNQRLAPMLYLGVVAITQQDTTFAINGDGPVVEYAVKLKQFDESGLADRLLGQSRVTSGQIDQLAETLADFHGRAVRAATDSTYGSPSTILEAAEHNFAHLCRIAKEFQLEPKPSQSGLAEMPKADVGVDTFGTLQALSLWTREQFRGIEGVFLARKKDGFIRECHGDLHSGNLVLIGGELVPFDCIEFSEDLRWIDCFSEIAFIFMDIEERGHTGLAWRLLNRYVEVSGDYAGLKTLVFYGVYRALVRAKVAALSAEQATDPGERSSRLAQCMRYLTYAAELRRRKQSTVLVITHGYSGSGKSFCAKALSECLPAIRIASDVERKRLAGLNAIDDSQSPIQSGIYTESMTRSTYQRLLCQADQGLRSGFNVILDATYLDASERRRCRELAERIGTRCLTLDFHAPEVVLTRRISERQRGGVDPSEADVAVLARQMERADPLGAGELPLVIRVDTTQQPDIDQIRRSIKEFSLATEPNTPWLTSIQTA